MIAVLRGLLDRGLERRYLRLLAGYAAIGLLQGVAFVLLAPAVHAVFSGDPAAGWPWVAALLAVCAVLLTGDVRGQVAGQRLGCEVGRHLFHRLGDHVATLPLGWFGADRVGRMGRLVSNGVLDVTTSIAHTQRRLVIAFSSPLAVLVGAFVIDWRAGVLLVAIVPPVGVVYRFGERAALGIDASQDAANVEAADRLAEFGRTQAVHRAFGRSAGGSAALEGSFADLRSAALRGLRLGVPAITGLVLTVQLCFVVAVLGGAALVLHHQLDTPTLLAVLVMVLKFSEPLQSAGPVTVQLRLERAAARRVAEVLAAPTLPEPATGAPTRPAAPAIELRDVRFGYDADHPVLDGVSLTVPRGQTVAIVGPSGSGKTTIARLVARFYDVQDGAVLVGGVDVREQTFAALMAAIAPVFQDVYLFAGSIEDNVRLGRPQASAAELAAAAEAARVDEIVGRLPDGWQTQVGEGGASLSGGERQRVSLARALLKDAPVVVLDEPTASLDAANEAAITHALRALTRSRTVLVIAHRLETIAAADLVVVLDAGRIVQAGRHSELMATRGTYADFWARRTEAANWHLTG